MIRDILYSLSVLIAGTGISCGQFLINPYAFAAGGGGGGGGAPSTNLIMDLDPDSIAIADGASADGIWQDSSSANNDMTQANGPTYRTSVALNGHSAVRFDNANDYGASALNLTKPYTIYIVEKVATADYNRTINSDSGNYLIANGRDTLVALAGSVASPVTAYAGVTVIGCLVAPASGDAGYYVDGTDVVSTPGTAVDWGTVTMGYNGVFDEPANSDVYRVLIYSAAHDSTARAAVQSYLETHFGL